MEPSKSPTKNNMRLSYIDLTRRWTLLLVINFNKLNIIFVIGKKYYFCYQFSLLSNLIFTKNSKDPCFRVPFQTQARTKNIYFHFFLFELSKF